MSKLFKEDLRLILVSKIQQLQRKLNNLKLQMIIMKQVNFLEVDLLIVINLKIQNVEHNIFHHQKFHPNQDIVISKKTVNITIQKLKEKLLKIYLKKNLTV